MVISAQISHKQNGRNICVIMRPMFSPIITTVALWRLMHSGTRCTHMMYPLIYQVHDLPRCHNAIVVITERAYCFHDYTCIYIYIANALARSCIDTYCNTALLSIKNTLCETKIIIFSKSY